MLLADGFNAKTKNAVVAAIKKEGATPAIIAPKVGGAVDSTGTKAVAEMALSGSPSVLFDAVIVLAGPAGDAALSADPNAISFLMDACRHLKAIGLSGVTTLAEKAQITDTDIVGVIELDSANHINEFIKHARNGKVWAREPAGEPA